MTYQAKKKFTVPDLRWALREHVSPPPRRLVNLKLGDIYGWMDRNLDYKGKQFVLDAAREHYLDHNPHRRPNAE